MRHLKLFLSLLLFYTLCWGAIDIYTVGAEDVQSLTEEAEDNCALSSQERSLLLEECIALAARNSFEVKLAQLDFLIAQTGQGVAEAIYDTVLSADISYEKDKRQPLSTFGADNKQINTYSIEATKKLSTGTEVTLSFDDTREWSNSAYVSKNPAHTAEAALEIRQPLGKNIFGYVDRRNISVTSLAIQNTDLDTKERIELLFANAGKAYWEWAFAKRGLQIYHDILERAKDLHKINDKNYDTGLIEKGDFLASEANILIREKDMLIAENKYRRSEENIKLLMNIETDEQIHPKDSLQYKEIDFDLGDCLSRAFQKRRDYQKAKREVEIENIILETKANERWPEIDLVASMTANGIDSKFSEAAGKITSEDNTDYFAGVEISLPLENNLARSEFKKAKHSKEKAIITLKKIERSIVTDVGNAFRDYITYEANVSKLSEVAELQKAKLKEEEKRLKYGRSNTKRSIDYQQDYLNAQLELASGLLDLEVARINLEKALNIILEKYARML